MTVLFPALKIVAKAIVGRHVSIRAAVRMTAYAVLAKLASDEEGGHGFLYKAHIGAMRGTFRREVKQRRAQAMVVRFRTAHPELAAMWRSA